MLVRLDTPHGLSATRIATFASPLGLALPRLIPAVAGWIGYNLAAQVALAGGFPAIGAPPRHFQVRAGQWGRSGPGLYNILRVGERVGLGDGLTPAQRAENTLQLFLGPLYETLTGQGYIDVPSALHAARQRVYRLRRDRRLRLFEHGTYIRISALSVPNRYPKPIIS